MDDNYIKELEEGVKGIESFMQNLSNFADEVAKDLTAEEKKIVDDEMSKLDLSDITSEIDKLKGKFNSFTK